MRAIAQERRRFGYRRLLIEGQSRTAWVLGQSETGRIEGGVRTIQGAWAMSELAKRAWLLSIEYGVSPGLTPTYGWFYVGFANEEAAKNALRAHLGTRVGKRVIKGERLLAPDEIAKNRLGNGQVVKFGGPKPRAQQNSPRALETSSPSRSSTLQ